MLKHRNHGEDDWWTNLPSVPRVIPSRKHKSLKESGSVSFLEYFFCKLEIKFYLYFFTDNWVACFYFVLFLEKVNCQHSTYVPVAEGILSVAMLYKCTVSRIQ